MNDEPAVTRAEGQALPTLPFIRLSDTLKYVEANVLLTEAIMNTILGLQTPEEAANEAVNKANQATESQNE